MSAEEEMIIDRVADVEETEDDTETPEASTTDTPPDAATTARG